MYFTTPIYHASQLIHRPVIIAALLKAAGALPGIDQRNLAELSGLSSPTIQRMEASEAMIRGNVVSRDRFGFARVASRLSLGP